MRENTNVKFITSFLKEYSKRMSDDDNILQAFTWSQINEWIISVEKERVRRCKHAREYQRNRRGEKSNETK